MRLSHLAISSLAALAMGLPPACLAAETAPADATGQGITIETSDKPLETVLQWISRRAGVNIVCNEAEQPRVTLRLINVGWQEAVDQIAIKYDLVVEKKSDRLWQMTRPPKVRMEFQDASLTVVLEALARQAGVNIVISDEIDRNKKLTMTLGGVPWREALDVIVKASGYAWIEQQYRIIRIVSPDKLTKDLVSSVYRLNYASVMSKSEGGGNGLETVLAGIPGVDKIIRDERTNSVIVSATPPAQQEVARLLTTLDTRTRQVQIEMRFVDFSVSDARKVGFDPVTASFDVANVGRVAMNSNPFGATPLATAALTSTAGGRPGANGRFSAGMTFEALAQLKSTEVLQAPSVLCLENTMAKLFIGREQRFPEQTAATVSNGVVTPGSLSEAKSSPIKDGITIEVTPTITSDGFVSMKLKALNELATKVTYSNGKSKAANDYVEIILPDKDQTNIETNIMVGDGKTGVIGGLLRNVTVEDERKVPLIGDIPVLGWLFKKRENSIDQRNLTIFIIPRVVHVQEADPYQRMRAELKSKLSGEQVSAPVQTNVNGEPVSGAGN